MSKEQSIVIKGIAILMMLWGHLFVNVEEVNGLLTLLPAVNCVPFVVWIKNLMPPVPFFLFLSGYGMWIVNSKPGGDGNRFGRIIHLYIVFWVTLLVFVPIGHIIHPEQYPGTMIKLLSNISDINPSYNTAMWFLLPYVLLALSAKGIIAITRNMNSWITMGGVYIVGTLISWLISRNVDFLNSYRLLYIAAEYFALMPPFLAGIYTAMYNIDNRFEEFFSSKPYVLAVCCFAALLVVKCVFRLNLFTLIYVFLFVLLWNRLRIAKWIRMALGFLGKYSMTMWMIHSYFYAYLFHDFIYSFQTPVVIFAVLVIVTLLVSIPLQWLGLKTYESLNRKVGIASVNGGG